MNSLFRVMYLVKHFIHVGHVLLKMINQLVYVWPAHTHVMKVINSMNCIRRGISDAIVETANLLITHANWH